MDFSKYDRQIRLFGSETQEKLCKMKVQLLGVSNAISMEIIKNIVLLGVGTVIMEETMFKNIKSFIPNKLEEINDKITIKFTEECIYNSTEIDDSFFLFIIDRNEVTNANAYYICSKCLSINFGHNHEKCDERNYDFEMQMHCLIGAYAVQEFIKFIQKKNFTKEYNFKF